MSLPLSRFQKPLIGILGGVGPAAGLLLHKKLITLNTDAQTDQEHFPVVHMCLPEYISDRSEYLLCADGSVPNPGAQMGELAVALGHTAAALQRDVVCAVACVTFHAPAIFAEFTEAIRKWNVHISGKKGRITVINMVTATVEYIRDVLGLRCVGLLSTTGTRKTGVYTFAAAKCGLKLVQVGDDDAAVEPVANERQRAVHDAVYNPTDGVKALSTGCKRTVAVLSDCVRELVGGGAEAVILGCTELPLAIGPDAAGVPLVDPMHVVAHRLIQFYKAAACVSIDSPKKKITHATE